MDSIRRELEEEVGVVPEQVVGTILKGYLSDDSSAVNSVHLGLVYEVVLNTQDIESQEKEKLAGEWMTKEQIRELFENDKLESWSKIVFENVIHENI